KLMKKLASRFCDALAKRLSQRNAPSFAVQSINKSTAARLVSTALSIGGKVAWCASIVDSRLQELKRMASARALLCRRHAPSRVWRLWLPSSNWSASSSHRFVTPARANNSATTLPMAPQPHTIVLQALNALENAPLE